MMANITKFSIIGSHASVTLSNRVFTIVEHAAAARYDEDRTGHHKGHILEAIKEAREALNKIEGMVEGVSEAEAA